MEKYRELIDAMRAQVDDGTPLSVCHLLDAGANALEYALNAGRCSCMEVFGEDPDCLVHGERAVQVGARKMRSHIAGEFRRAGCNDLASKILCIDVYDVVPRNKHD